MKIIFAMFSLVFISNFSYAAYTVNSYSNISGIDGLCAYETSYIKSYLAWKLSSEETLHAISKLDPSNKDYLKTKKILDGLLKDSREYQRRSFEEVVKQESSTIILVTANVTIDEPVEISAAKFVEKNDKYEIEKVFVSPSLEKDPVSGNSILVKGTYLFQMTPIGICSFYDENFDTERAVKKFLETTFEI